MWFLNEAKNKKKTEDMNFLKTKQTDISMKYSTNYRIIIEVSLSEPHLMQSQLNEQMNECLYTATGHWL